MASPNTASPSVSYTSDQNNIIYNKIGVKTIRLIIEDKNGCTDTMDRNIHVKEHPIATIENSSKSSQCKYLNSFDLNAIKSTAVNNSQ